MVPQSERTPIHYRGQSGTALRAEEMHILHEPLKQKPKCRVELHVHLDGAIRPETIWEVMRRKGMKLPGNGSLADLKVALKVQEPQDLKFMLEAFQIFLPAIRGDLEVIERIAYEFVEDEARESVAYCEVRFCPHLLLPASPHVGGATNGAVDGANGDVEVTTDQVLEAVLRGLARGEQEFDTKVRVILCCLRGQSEFSWDLLRLCEEYRDRGVVGIDLAGDEACREDMIDPVDVAVFEAAREKGIHRTVHAGEAGSAECVKIALDTFGAERIGHGYRVIENEDIYQRCLKEKVHFEVCPHSSYLTGAIKSLVSPSKRHPVLRFVEDGASFSINTDDPTLTSTRLCDEYALLNSWGFTEAHITRANFQAALHSFLPPEEKRELIAQLREAYGIIFEAPPSTTASLQPPPPPLPAPPPPLKPSVTFGTWAERA